MITLHPDIQRLRDRERELQESLHSLLHELYVLEHETYRDLTEQYNKHFRELESRLQVESLRAAEMKRRIELFSIRCRQGKKIEASEIEIVNQMIQREFRVYYERMRDSFQQTPEQREADRRASMSNDAEETLRNDSSKSSNKNPHREVRVKELQKLYRDLVKQLHPDVSEQQSQFEKFWFLVRDAYDASDLSRLRLLHNLVCQQKSLEVLSESDVDMETLAKHVRHLEMRLDYEQRKVTRIKEQEPYSLIAMLQNEEARFQHANVLRSKIQKQERIVKSGSEQLRLLLGQDWEQFLKSDTDAKEAYDFQDEFIQNTYFSSRA